MQHGVKMQLIDLGDGADVPRHAPLHLLMLLALELEQVSHLEGLAALAYEQLAILADRALMDPEHAQLAYEGVNMHLEHMGQSVFVRIRRHRDRFRRRAVAAEEPRRLHFPGVGHQPGEDVQEFRHAGARRRGNKTNGDEVALPQRLLERLVQLFRLHVFPLLQIFLHQLLVQFNHLINDVGVGLRHRGEIRVLAAGLEKAVHHFRTAAGRQVQRQALVAVSLPQLRQYALEIGFVRIDFIDDEQAIHAPLAGDFHELAGGGLDACFRVHHHRAGLHGGQHRQGAAKKIRVARRVDEIHMAAAMVQVNNDAVQGVLVGFFLGVEIAHRRPLVHRALLRDRAGLVQQRLHQGGLSRTAVAGNGQVANVLRCVARHQCLLVLSLFPSLRRRPPERG